MFGVDRWHVVSSHKCLCWLASSGIRVRWFFQQRSLAHRRLCMECGNRRGLHGHEYPQILKWQSVINLHKFPTTFRSSPFKDLMYACQNLAFLFGDSLYPIIARCCLNILLLLFVFFSTGKICRSLRKRGEDLWLSLAHLPSNFFFFLSQPKKISS